MYGIETGNSHPVKVEMEFIRHGGHITHSGKKYGMGLFHHYRNLQQLLWPEGEDHHRWSDLMLHHILEERIVAVSGARDSGKTHVALSRYGITDYFCFPKETLVLVSSTDLRGLRLRVWGSMVDLFRRAKERHPWLPGHVLESMHGIFTDELTEDTPIRDIRRGIIAIPCLDRKGTWVGGLEKFIGIKQKRRRLLGDECFVAGTMVSTPFGNKPIESIKEGDVVFSAYGIDLVTQTHQQSVSELIQLHLTSGSAITCTPNHEFLTDAGWKRAVDIRLQDVLISQYEIAKMQAKELSSMRQAFYPFRQQGDLLFKELWGDMEVAAAGDSEKAFGVGSWANIGISQQGDHVQPGGKTQKAESDDCSLANPVEESGGVKGIWRDWDWAQENRNGGNFVPTFPGGHLQPLCSNGTIFKEEEGPHILSGPVLAGSEIGRGDRWLLPSLSESTEEGPATRCVSEIVRVDRITSFRATGEARPNENQKPYRVYNISVKRHPSYFVEGVCVHNCQFMHQDYLTTLSNLDKGDFKGVFVGNALANMKALDKISEPLEGWGNHPDPTKTEVFRNRYGGVTITLVGTDSPNFDVPETQPVPFPYLVDRKDEKSVGDRYGRNSEQYYSQIAGYRKPGLFAHRVLTQEMCEKYGAFQEVVWHGDGTTKVYACDMGFGGDRCVAGWGEFGHEVGGLMVFRVHAPKVIPLAVDAEPEDQIALYIREDCKGLNIPGSNVFFDAGMKATAATAMAKIFSPECSAVNFGGSPTKRPVSSDEYVIDRETGFKRLKRCDEHYIKFVTELWFSVRLTVMGRQMRELPRDVAEEFYLREWTKEKGDRYEIEKKEDTKDRTGVSPDLGDWLAILIEGARRLGFMIEILPEYQGQSKGDDDYLSKELTRFMMQRKKRTLSYSK